MESCIHPIGYLGTYKYVVILSRYQGKILLSRHRERTTWETQGGHVEPGETPLDAANRELFEESGAVEYDIVPLCDYIAGDKETGRFATGMVFAADIHKLVDIPPSEMAEVRLFDALPQNVTYPAITPHLFAYLEAQGDDFCYTSIIGREVYVRIDRAMGGAHPAYPDMIYPVNYGFVSAVIGGDGEEQDAYVLGIDHAVTEFAGVVAAVIHRKDDVEDKWVVCPRGISLSREEILGKTAFQEKHFDSELEMNE